REATISMSKIRYNKKVQDEIISNYINGSSINELTEKYSISKSTIYRWTKEIKVKNQTNKNNITKLNEILIENRKLKKEIKILKSAIEILSVSK
ncbi:helix-turn-helix domain-containing protein, partial [Bacillus cereus]